MRALKIVTIVAMLAAAPAFADQEAEVVGAGGVGFPPDPSAPVWDAPDVVLYDNGPLVTHAGGGAGGADASAVQTGLGMSTYGFGFQSTVPNRMADDFTVTDAGGWQIDSIAFYGYQTGSSTTSTFTEIYVQIWNGPPNGGGSVVWGDLTTNRLSTTSWSNIYRVLDTGLTDTARPIMVIVATIGTTLPAGTYWVEYTANGTGASGPWAPPITVLGQTTTGNALQYTQSTGAWAAAVDNLALTQQGMPFVIDGTAQGGGGGGGGGGGTGGVSNPIPTLSKTGVVVLVLAIIGISAILIRRRM